MLRCNAGGGPDGFSPEYMEVILEIQTGPRAGETIVIKDGQTVTVGRASIADFALPQDTFLSRVHFAVECANSTCRIVDRQSANGTLVNGARLSDPVVASEGDIVLAGQTKFAVHIVSDPPVKPARPASEDPITDRPIRLPLAAPSQPFFSVQADTVSMGSWFFGIIPEGWQVVEGFGLRRHERNAFPSEAMVSETVLAHGQTFDQYIESQLDLVRLLVSQPHIQEAEPTAIAGAEEGKAYNIRYKMDDGRRFFQRQFYLRRGPAAGALAFTTLEDEVPAIQPILDQVLRGLAFGRLS